MVWHERSHRDPRHRWFRQEAGEVMPDEHRGVAVVGVAGDVKPRAGAHRHRCQRCNAATAGGCSASTRDRITRAERASGQASRIGATDCSPAADLDRLGSRRGRPAVNGRDCSCQRAAGTAPRTRARGRTADPDRLGVRWDDRGTIAHSDPRPLGRGAAPQLRQGGKRSPRSWVDFGTISVPPG